MCPRIPASQFPLASTLRLVRPVDGSCTGPSLGDLGIPRCLLRTALAIIANCRLDCLQPAVHSLILTLHSKTRVFANCNSDLTFPSPWPQVPRTYLLGAQIVMVARTGGWCDLLPWYPAPGQSSPSTCSSLATSGGWRSCSAVLNPTLAVIGPYPGTRGSSTHPIMLPAQMPSVAVQALPLASPSVPFQEPPSLHVLLPSGPQFTLHMSTSGVSDCQLHGLVRRTQVTTNN